MSDNLPERSPDRYLTHADLDLMFRLAKAYAMSAFFEDAAAEMKAFVIIEAGRELGLMPFESFQYIDVIKGKPVLNSAFFATSIRRHEHYDYVVDTLTNELCKITFLRDGEIIGESTFDQEDAKLAGLLGGRGQMYEKYPRNMLFARALSNGAAWFTPDVVTVRPYIEGELEDDYLATKAEREAARAAERLALAAAQAAAEGTTPPAEPVEPGEQVVDGTAEEEPSMDTAVQEPMTGTASATLDPEALKAAEREQQERYDAEKPMLDQRAATEQTAEQKILSDQEKNVAVIRELVVSGLQGEERTTCHEALKYLEIWGKDAPQALWLLFGKKALAWKTLGPALDKAVKAEVARREKAAAEATPEPEGEPPFGPEEEQIIVDVTPEGETPAAAPEPWDES